MSRCSIYINYESGGYTLSVCKKKEMLYKKFFFLDFSGAITEDELNRIVYDTSYNIKILKKHYRIGNFIIIFQNDIYFRTVKSIKGTKSKNIEKRIDAYIKDSDKTSLNRKEYAKYIRKAGDDGVGNYDSFICVSYPKKIFAISDMLSKKTMLDCMGIYMDFQLIEEIYKEELYKDKGKKSIIIESREGDCVFSVAGNSRIYSSFTISDEETDPELIYRYICDTEKILMTGKRNSVTDSILNCIYNYGSENFTGDEASLSYEITDDERSLAGLLIERDFSKLKSENLYYSDENESVFLNTLNRCFFILLIIILALTWKSQETYRELYRELNDKKEMAFTEQSPEKRQAKDIDSKNLGRIINILNSRIKSMEYTKDGLQIEFVTENKAELNRIMKKDIFKKSDIRWIKKIKDDKRAVRDKSIENTERDEELSDEKSREQKSADEKKGEKSGQKVDSKDMHKKPRAEPEEKFLVKIKFRKV